MAEAVHVREAAHRYGDTRALHGVDLAVDEGRLFGVIGPDGVGKSTLLGLIAGVKHVQSGEIAVLGGDMAREHHRLAVCHRIAFMPQGLGQNLYGELSVAENIDFFGRLFSIPRAHLRQRRDELMAATGLAPFARRRARNLSGGMKQKLGLCCALIHEPDLLLLDEPTTGVDPLSREEFWELIQRMRENAPRMAVIVATSYMPEADRFDDLAMMNDGRLIAEGTPAELKQRTGADTLDNAYIRLLPEDKRQGHAAFEDEERPTPSAEPAVEARGLTRRFGSFTAVDSVDFQIGRGEIFGFVGPNGCGKTTTMKMVTGLLRPSAGEAELFGRKVKAGDRDLRRNLGYMSQSFSLYGELTVGQNLTLHARLFGVPPGAIGERVTETLDRYDLEGVRNETAGDLPLGLRQRLSLAVAVIHRPAILILDEPTSGVDPVARDLFWARLQELARDFGTTIFVSTHYLAEAMRCDRVALMNAGHILACDTPEGLIESRGAIDLEAAFVEYIREDRGEGSSPHPNPSPPGRGAMGAPLHRGKATNTADGGPSNHGKAPNAAASPSPPGSGVGESSVDRGKAAGTAESPSDGMVSSPPRNHRKAPNAAASPSPSGRGVGVRARGFSPARLVALAWRETLQIWRDPFRLFSAFLVPVMLMLIFGFGLNLDIQRLPFAVLDQDQTPESREYVQAFAASPYFDKTVVVDSQAAMEKSFQQGQTRLGIEIPPDFGADLRSGRPTEVALRIEGTMPYRAETARGYALGVHADHVERLARDRGLEALLAADVNVATRYWYNQALLSKNAFVPGLIAAILVLIPAMLTAVAVVRERELGSITNFYATPTRKLEFLWGKQLPYAVITFLNFVILAGLTVFLFDVPIGGSITALVLGAIPFAFAATSIGLLISIFTRTQVAASFVTLILTMIPSFQYSGLLSPVSSLEGGSWLFGNLFPTTYFLNISVGTFTKDLGVAPLLDDYAALVIFFAVITAASTLLLRKRER